MLFGVRKCTSCCWEVQGLVRSVEVVEVLEVVVVAVFQPYSCRSRDPTCSCGSYTESEGGVYHEGFVVQTARRHLSC